MIASEAATHRGYAPPMCQPCGACKAWTPDEEHLRETFGNRTNSAQYGLLHGKTTYPQPDPAKVLCYTHIAKAGGTEVFSRLALWRYTVPGDGETCYPVFRAGSEGQPHALMLRHPTHHVISQWRMCAESEWGRGQTRRSRHAATVDRWRTDVHGAGLLGWLDWFASKPGQTETFGCYSPENMLTRALTCSVGSSHGYWGPLNVTVALQNVESVEHLGVMELLEPSLCVWHFRTHGVLPAGGECAAACGGASRSAAGSRSADAVPAVLSRIHQLTAHDRVVYAAALTRVLRDIYATESRSGTKLVCDDDVSALQVSLSGL